VLLTPGDYDEALPSWSPDGTTIAFSTKRGKDPDRGTNWDIYTIPAAPGSQPQQLTTFEGSDADPYWESRPVWSPDGKWIAYLQGGPPKLIYYGVERLAVVPAAGGAARVVSPDLDRWVSKPRWSRDGRSILFLLEDDGHYHLARVPADGGPVERLVSRSGGVGAPSTRPDARPPVPAGAPRP